MGRVPKFGKFLYLGLVLTCQGFPGFFGQIHENLSPLNFSYSLFSAKKFTFFFNEVVIWRSFSIKNNCSALRCFELRITTGYRLCGRIYYNFNIFAWIFFIIILITDQVCSTKIFKSAIFSVSLKFGTFYITDLWDYFRIKTATLWCLTDIPTLINFPNFFQLGHSYSTPIFSQPVYSNLPANQILVVFPSCPNIATPFYQAPRNTICSHLLFWHFFVFHHKIIVFSIFIPLFDQVSNFRNTIISNKKKES